MCPPAISMPRMHFVSDNDTREKVHRLGHRVTIAQDSEIRIQRNAERSVLSDVKRCESSVIVIISLDKRAQ